MNSQEKVNLINTLHPKVEDYDCDNEECIYVLVPEDEETISVLKQLGFSDREIQGATEDESVDISMFGFQFADWWGSKDGFSIKEADNA